MTLGAVAQVLNKDGIPRGKVLTCIVMADRAGRAVRLAHISRLNGHVVAVAMTIKGGRVAGDALSTSCLALSAALQGAIISFVTALASKRRVDLARGHKRGCGCRVATDTVGRGWRGHRVDPHQVAVICIGVVYKIGAVASIAVAGNHGGCRPCG